MRSLYSLLSVWERYCLPLIRSGQQDPLRFIEVLMLSLAMAIVLLMIGHVLQSWPFWALSLSYAFGAACSALVRESIFPSPLTSWVRLSAVLLILASIYGLFELVQSV